MQSKDRKERSQFTNHTSKFVSFFSLVSHRIIPAQESEGEAQGIHLRQWRRTVFLRHMVKIYNLWTIQKMRTFSLINISC